jgi:DNA-binding GntR family transcriptional regulator
VYHLLSLLEADAASVVAMHATDAQLKELQTLHDSLEKATKNRERFFEINEAFHMRLLEVANNRWRDQMVADLRKVMKLNRHNSLLKTGRIEESLAEHRTIMAAMASRNADLAARAMRTHFANGLEAAV